MMTASIPEKAVGFLTASEISALVVSREVSAREVAEAMLARIKTIDGDVNAFIEVTPELAFAAADALDARIAAGDGAAELGELAAVPVAFKDNMNLVGTRTTCASNLLRDFQSLYDCTAVQRLLAAGTIPLGKLNMDEFAFGSTTESSAFGPTHNPWDVERVPGGSSGGSAAAVAAGLATITLGSDTGGSIRQPGAFTGTVALKPSSGRVSRYGCVAFASSLDQIGPLSHTVRDSALALAAICGKDSLDATSADRPTEDFAACCEQDVKGMRVALPTDLLQQESLDPRLRQEVMDSAEILARFGAEIVEVTLPMAVYSMAAYHILGSAEASSSLARLDTIRYGCRVEGAEDILDLYLRSRAEGFGPESIRRILLGTYVLSAGNYDRYYDRAQKVRTLIRDDFANAFAQADVILSPTTAHLSLKFGQYAQDFATACLADCYTTPVNLAGVAGLSLPTRLIDGLPASVQIIANHFCESDIFRAAAALERELRFPYKSVTVR
jgi:aspartyl-tRNA(Asn)/glutamyl-tRNA(Gln) amidotransferase subunit A